VTVAQVDRHVRERFVEGIADLAPAFQPSINPVVQLPVMFASGQVGGPHEETFRVVGLSVGLVARPSWVWRFGDGAATRTSDPGGGYPGSGVTHAYRAAGRYSVRVTTEWSAAFTVAGLGPFPVTEPVSQERRFSIDVGEGRALLRP
jgi:PKD repeat protein